MNRNAWQTGMWMLTAALWCGAAGQVWPQSGMGSGGTGGGSFGSTAGSSGGFSSNFATGAGSGTPGSTASFSGNLDTGTAFGTNTGQGAGAGRATGVPTTANPFQAFYANPQSLGQQLVTITTTGGTANTVPAFGQPIYATTTTTATGLGTRGGVGAAAGLTSAATGGLGAGTLSATSGGLGGTSLGGTALGGTALGGGGLGGVGLGGTGAASSAAVVTAIPLAGFSTIGMPRSPTYITVLGFTPTRLNGALRTDLQQVVARSSLMSSRGIQVTTDGQTVVLRGVVPDEHEARLAEGIIRLTPGVRQVRNELIVRP